LNWFPLDKRDPTPRPCAQDTPLNCKGNIHLIGGWNRWSHRLTIGPLAMVPPDVPAQVRVRARVWVRVWVSV